MNEKQEKKTSKALKQIDKDFGKNTVMKLGTKECLKFHPYQLGHFP